jgi:hypothetical protein
VVGILVVDLVIGVLAWALWPCVASRWAALGHDSLHFSVRHIDTSEITPKSRYEVSLLPSNRAETQNLVEPSRRRCVMPEITEVLPGPVVALRWGSAARDRLGTLRS